MIKLVSTIVLFVVSSCGLLAAVDRLPEVIKQTDIDYPETLSGPAVVEVVLSIGVDGKVASAEIRNSSKHELDAVCLEALVKWRFKPATVAGQPVAVKALVPVIFDNNRGSSGRMKWASND